MFEKQAINETIQYFSVGSNISGHIWYPNQMSKLTEYAGRICYNSHDKITDTSDIGFNKRTMKSVHLSVEAHGYIGVEIFIEENYDTIYRELCAHIFNHCKLMNVYGRAYHQNKVLGMDGRIYEADLDSGTIKLHFNIRMLIDYLMNVKNNPKRETEIEAYTFQFTALMISITEQIPMLNPLYNLMKGYLDVMTPVDTIIKEQIVWSDENTIVRYDHNGDCVVYHENILPGPIMPFALDTGINGVEIDILNVSMSPDWLPGYHFFNTGNPSMSFEDPVMGSVTFHLKVDRTVSHQELRHWESIFTDESVLELHAASQKSQRYVNESNFECYVRENVDRKKKYLVKVGESTIELSIDDLVSVDAQMYGHLIQDGYKKEEARNILPTGAYTDIIITKEFRALPHYFAERTAPGAQLEIRSYATALMNFMKSLNLKEGIFEPSKYNVELSEIE